MGFPTSLFLDQPPCEDLICPICHDVMKEAECSGCCGHSFCKHCIQLRYASSSSCPSCQKRLLPYSSIPNLSLQHLIGKLQVSCPYYVLITVPQKEESKHNNSFSFPTPHNTLRTTTTAHHKEDASLGRCRQHQVVITRTGGATSTKRKFNTNEKEEYCNDCFHAVRCSWKGSLYEWAQHYLDSLVATTANPTKPKHMKLHHGTTSDDLTGGGGPVEKNVNHKKESLEDYVERLNGYMKLLEHASTCRSMTTICPITCSRNCTRLKQLLRHATFCGQRQVLEKKATITGKMSGREGGPSCKLCHKLSLSMLMHARICNKPPSVCTVPYCSAFKKHYCTATTPTTTEKNGEKGITPNRTRRLRISTKKRARSFRLPTRSFAKSF